MTGYFAPAGKVRSGVEIPRIWITIAVSILLHALALWQVKPDLLRPSSDEALKGESHGPLSVQIAPPPRPRIAQRPQPPVPPPVPRVVPREAARPRVAVRPPPPPPPR